MKKSTTTPNTPAKKQGGPAGGLGKRAGSEQPGKGEPIDRDEEERENAHGRTIHNGSAGAFDATEHSHDEEDEDQDSDDFAMDR
jgi:hypothetical protein